MKRAAFLFLYLQIAVLFGGAVVAGVRDAQEPHTELEQLQIENLALKQQVIGITYRAETCEGKLAPYNLAIDRQTLDGETRALKQRLEAARPGWEWDGTTYRKKDGR